MRQHLRAIEGQRAAFRATFSRFSYRTNRGYIIHTALFVDVRNEQGIEVCDHIWMRKGKQIDRLNLQPGDVIQFNATSEAYWSGYHDNRHKNYGLKFPTKLRRVEMHYNPASGNEEITQQAIEELPLFNNHEETIRNPGTQEKEATKAARSQEDRHRQSRWPVSR